MAGNELEILRRLRDLERKVERLQAVEYPLQAVALPKIVRVLSDSTARAAGYVNNAVQVTGAVDLNTGWATLPSKMTAIWYTVTIRSSATGASAGLAIENPDNTDGGTSISGYAGAINNLIIGGGFVTLSSTGKVQITVRNVATSLIIIDVHAYIP